MKFKKRFLIVCLIICLFSIVSVCAGDVNDTIVASDDNQIELSQDSIDDVMEDDNLKSNEIDKILTENPKTFTNLNDKINGNDSSDVYLDSNYKFELGTDDSFKNGITISRAVTIHGNNFSIDGNNTARIFTVTNNNVIFKDITFVNGKSNGDFGGAIYGKCTAVNCIFNSNSAFNGGAIFNGNALNCTFNSNSAIQSAGAIFGGYAENCTFNSNSADFTGGAIFDSEALNCTFNFNTARDGGAMDQCIATNCAFNFNSASKGGAVSGGSAINCTFTNNKAASDGGAMYCEGFTATNCQFINNTAKNGGATYQIRVDNCNFTKNTAKEYGGAMYGGYAIDCIFKDNNAGIGGDNTYNTDFPKSILIVNNFTSTYNSGDKLSFKFTSDSGKPINNTIITIRVYKNNTLIGTYYALSDEGWIVNIDAGSYIAVCSVENQAYNVDQVNATLTISKVNSRLNVDEMAFDYGSSGTTTITYTGATGVAAEVVNQSKANIIIKGKKITVSGLDAGIYTLRVTTISDVNHNNITKTTTITVNKLDTQLKSSAITTIYNIGKNLVISLKDAKGKSISGVKVTVNLKGVKTYFTSKNGQVKVSTKGLTPKTYAVKITFPGDVNYYKSSKSVRVTVKKATPKLTAKSKTFKKAKKVKKYTIKLKTNKNKAMKKVKVTLKIKGKKAITAKTSNKGVATFIVKLTKKGTFKSTVTFKGNKYYNKVTKKVNIKIK